MIHVTTHAWVLRQNPYIINIYNTHPSNDVSSLANFDFITAQSGFTQHKLRRTYDMIQQRMNVERKLQTQPNSSDSQHSNQSIIN